MTGYILSNTTYAIDIIWSKDGDPVHMANHAIISNNSQNMIVTGEGIIVPSIISTLHINMIDDVAGNYGCTVHDGYFVLYTNLSVHYHEG